MSLPAVRLDDMLPLHRWIALSPGDSLETESGVPPTAEIDAEWLLAAASEAVLIVDSQTEIILRVNPATSTLLKLPQSALLGVAFLSIFEENSASEMRRDLAEAKRSGSAGAAIVKERLGGRSVSVRLSLIRGGAQSYLLVRLESRETAARAPHLNPESAVMDAIDSAPMGFLIAAADFHVEYANRAFVSMVEAQSQGDVRGSSILRWLRFTAADVSRLSARLSQRQATDVLITALHPNHGSPKPVEVCAVPVPDGLDTQWGFTVRHLPRLN